MVLASLFLMWGREAWHLTQLLAEPVYFVSGLNFPVAALGRLGALAIATIPLAVGLDAMRQLAFAGQRTSRYVLPPEVEAAILVAHDRGLRRSLARFSSRNLERARPARGPPDDALAMTAPAAGLDRTATPLLRPRAGPTAAAAIDLCRQLPDGRLARLEDGGELDRPGPVLHLLGGQAGQRGAHPRRDARGHRRCVGPRVPRLRRRRQRALVVRHLRASPGWPGRSSTTASATGCSSTSTSARATSSSSCSAAGRPGSRSGRWAR